MTQRCFLALPVDDVTAEAVLAVQPREAAVRRVPREQLHLTLHFLGPQDVSAVTAQMSGLRFACVQVVVDSVGTFVGADGAQVLWAGAEPTAALLELRDACSRRLAPLGFTAEARPYRPHITLGRAPATFDTDGFLSSPAPTAAFGASHVHLYTSVMTEAGPRFDVVGTFGAADSV